MGEIQINDELLYSCMPAFEEKLLKAIPDDAGSDYQFSKEFEQNMQMLVRRVRQKKKYGIPLSTWRRIAAMLAITLSGVFAVVMNVDAVRQKAFGFIETVYETYVERQYFSEENVIQKFVPLHPTYIAEGYELAIADSSGGSYFTSYESADGEECITIFQNQLCDGTIVTEDNEYADEEKCIVQGVQGVIGHKENGTIRIKWEKNNCMYLVSATNLAKEEVLKICEGLE